jgi:hypothetical protein
MQPTESSCCTLPQEYITTHRMANHVDKKPQWVSGPWNASRKGRRHNRSLLPQAGLVESAANRKHPHQMSSSRSVPAWANKDTAKSALAVVGAAALSVSLFHSLKVLWRTYEQRVTNKRLEEYPNPVALCPNSPFFLQRSLHPWFALSLSLPHPPPHSPRHAAARCNSRDVAHIHILFVIGGAP